MKTDFIFSIESEVIVWIIPRQDVKRRKINCSKVKEELANTLPNIFELLKN
jgi:hypothetical protein